MTSDVRTDLSAAAAILGRGLVATTGVIRDTHVAIAGRVFRLTGPPATPTRLMHNGISKGVYAAVGVGARATSYAAGAAAGRFAAHRYRPAPYVGFGDRPTGDVLVGAVNGAWGDHLLKWHNPLALPMSVRVDHRDVALDRDSLSHAFRNASSDVVVFLHGLCETERAWWLAAARHYGDVTSTHGSRLAALTGATPVYLRYNTGRHISDNGTELAELLASLTDHWPVPVQRLTLVGHSMGGLVTRSACAQAVESGQPWVGLVRRIVYLGSPHLGAPLEVAAAAAGVTLRRLPETAPLGRALASRSVGIKDLRFGDVLSSDWSSIEDPDAWRPEPQAVTELLADVDHYFIGATVTRRRDHPVARVLGDALVTYDSASGDNRRRRLGFHVDRGCHLGGLHHFDLLNHPRVWDLLQSWLGDCTP